jgi:hypothetical protein
MEEFSGRFVQKKNQAGVVKSKPIIDVLLWLVP